MKLLIFTIETLRNSLLGLLTQRRINMKFIGYMLIAAGSMILSLNGFGIDTWQWWAITLCFITGEFLTCNADE